MRRALILVAACLLIPIELAQLVRTVEQRATKQTVEPVVSVDPQEVKCLATMVYGEARGESVQGKIAVAWSAVNRQLKKANKTVCQVVLAPLQYSIFNNNPTLRAAATSLDIEPRQKNAIDTETWVESQRVAEQVLAGYAPDPTGGATHYIADRVMRQKGYVYPKWSRQYRQVAVIENHRFFVPHYPKKKK